MPIRLTRVVKILLVANVATFIIQQSVDRFMGGNLLGWLALIPSGVVMNFRVWQLGTYAFLHADVLHLFLNMVMLAFTGPELEAQWGVRRFVRFYLFCLLIAGLAYLAIQLMFGDLHSPMVGASGAIYGLLTAYGILFGERTVLFMMVMPMKAKHFVWLLAAMNFMTTVFSPGGALSGVAHLGGMAGGFGLLLFDAHWSRRRRESAARKAAERVTSHLKLVVDNEKKRLKVGGAAWNDDDENSGQGPGDKNTWN